MYDVSMSIRCSRCLTWSVEDADFCHKCGKYLRTSFPKQEFTEVCDTLCGLLNICADKLYSLVGNKNDTR